VTIVVLKPANAIENINSVVAFDGLGRHFYYKNQSLL
jgi:hypothetical protein